MAEKGFGVKEINLIGASGTPTIESPNNLNLNAVNVAISTNVSIGGTLSVTGNVSVGGTLTYEDVTNVDSVGVITARSGIQGIGIQSGGVNVAVGVITARRLALTFGNACLIGIAEIAGVAPLQRYVFAIRYTVTEGSIADEVICTFIVGLTGRETVAVMLHAEVTRSTVIIGLAHGRVRVVATALRLWNTEGAILILT